MLLVSVMTESESSGVRGERQESGVGEALDRSGIQQ